MEKATDSLDGYSDAEHTRALSRLLQDIANAPTVVDNPGEDYDGYDAGDEIDFGDCFGEDYT